MILNEALRLYQMGWCVLPLKPRTKRPALQSWKRYQKQRPSESTIRNWFKSDTDRGLAVCLGAVSGGLVCRDFDQMDAYEAWAAEYPELAATLPQSETSRGRHVFCMAADHAVESLSPTGASTIPFDDGELRGGNCYVVLPPSTHPSGHVYRWLIPPGDTIPFADLADTGLNRCWAEPDVESTDPDAGQHSGFTECTERTEPTQCTDEDRSHGRRGSLANSIDFFSIGDETEQAIAATLPTGEGQRNNALFSLAQRLKSLPALCEADPRSLDSVVQEWHRRALPVIGTESLEESVADFRRAWRNVKFPAGVMRPLFEAAMTEPLPHCCERYATFEVKQLIVLCRALHEHWRPEPFFLSCRVAGELLNVSHTTANKWLYLLADDEVLFEVEKGSQAGRRASRFRYCGD